MPFWDPYCLISTSMTYFISSKRRSCLTMLMMISCILLILIQLLSNIFSRRNLWWCVSGFVITRWSWTLKMQGAGSLAKARCQAITICWKCCFTLVDTVDLFGVTLNDSVNFGKHFTKISKKVGELLDVLCRLKKISSFPTKLCLYTSFIMSHFHYCFSV